MGSRGRATPRPTLADVRELARLFGVSLTVAARRFAELSPWPCAFVEAKDGKVKRAKRSATFRGEAVQGRLLDDGTLALYATCGPTCGPTSGRRGRPETRREHGFAWGASRAGGVVVEECVSLRGDGGALVWLRHD